MLHPSLIQLTMRCLKLHAQALTPREIARMLLNERSISGITLDALTDRVQIDLEMERHTRGEASRFTRHGDRYALLERVDSEATSAVDLIDALPQSSSTSLPQSEPGYNESKSDDEDALIERSMLMAQVHVLDLAIRDYPLAHQVSSLLCLTHGERYALVESLRRALRRFDRLARGEGAEPSTISEVRGSGEIRVNTAEPATVDEWIHVNLSGSSATLARRIWEGSGRLLPPQVFERCWSLIEHYGLMDVSDDGVWRITERGMQITSTEGWSALPSHVTRDIDQREGVTDLLMTCLELSQPDTDMLNQAWAKRMRRLKKRKSSAWFIDATRSRLRHLSARGLLIRELHRWRLTEEGLAWLREGGVSAPSADHEALESVWSALRRQRELARSSMAALLDRMDPHRFEELVCELLERMGYEEIQLTLRTHDMGVDVVATIELGITAAREVVQVKRQHRAIHRPTLDALRGSLHRFNAVRGTLITTSTFSKGTREAAFEHGAAPITLIDGDRLIDLLMTHELGVKPIEVKLWQVDPKVFEEGSGRVWPRWSHSSKKRQG